MVKLRWVREALTRVFCSTRWCVRPKTLIVVQGRFFVPGQTAVKSVEQVKPSAATTVAAGFLVVPEQDQQIR